MKHLFLKIVAASLLGAQLLGTISVVAESMSVDHYLCLEHQEWSHEEKGAVIASHAPASEDLADHLKAHAADSPEHGHCDLVSCGSRAPGLAVRPGPSILPPTPLRSPADPLYSRETALGIALYRLAPKNSPPLLD